MIENPWKILIVDDEKNIHHLTHLCLKRFSFQRRSLKIFDAYSTSEAKQILIQHPDIAVIFLDIVMEKFDSGLSITKFIRKKLNNQKIRIIIRTGQPGKAPEDEIINQYAIHDYHIKGKKERSLVSSLKLALNAYQDLIINEDYKKILEVENINYQEKLSSSNLIAGSIAHEFRNPLATFLTSISLIDQILEKNKFNFIEGDYEMGTSILEIMKKTIKKYNTLVDITLKNLKKDEIDQTKFYLFSVADCINDTINSYPFYSSKERDSIKINLEKDFYICGIEELLQFTFFNLIKNSLYVLKDREVKNIIITINGNKRQITFYDSGHGIPSDQLPYIFNNFMTKGKKGGSGLGLPFCKCVMTNFGGDIVCQSEINQFTEFILTFPPVDC